MSEKAGPSQPPGKDNGDEKQDSIEDAEARRDEKVAPDDDSKSKQDDDDNDPKPPVRRPPPGLLRRLDICQD